MVDLGMMLLYLIHPFPTVYKLVSTVYRRFLHRIISILLGHNTIKIYTWSNSTPSSIGNEENIQNKEDREELVVSKSSSESHLHFNYTSSSFPHSFKGQIKANQRISNLSHFSLFNITSFSMFYFHFPYFFQ